MRSRADLVVAPGPGPAGWRVERMVHAPPVAWRPTPEAVYLIGTAASPVGDDDLGISVTVRPGAYLTARSSAATVIWSGRRTRQTVHAEVEAGGALDWALEPLVTTAGCNHTQAATVRLHGNARLRWREVLVLGRHGEPTGRLRSVLSVLADGGPLLHHELVVGGELPGWDGPAVLGRSGAVGLLLVAAADLAGAGSHRGDGWSVMPLEGPGVLALALGGSASAVEAALDAAEKAIPELEGVAAGRTTMLTR